DPRPADAGRAGRTLLVLVDRSASMSAATGGPARGADRTRLGQARSLARALAAGLGPNERAMIASFASGVAAESGFEDDGARLEAAVERIAATEEPADLGRALGF